MDWYLGNYWLLFLLLLLPLSGIIMFQYIKWKNKKKILFAEDRFQKNIFEKPSKFSKFLPTLYLFALLFLIFSIIDVVKGSEEIQTKQKLSNVIFALDVSNSMNAQDLEPNRLTEAKNLILQTISKLGNDKVGIVVFAGEAHSIMPLTTDFSAADTYLGGVETNIEQIQGTDFLKAIQASALKFQHIPKGARKIVLVSDGEDNEGKENEAIKEAKDQGIAVTTVGIGSEEGAPIPEYAFGQLMGYKTDMMGETVISKRQVNALKNIAEETGGSYIDGNNLESATQLIVEDLNKKSTLSNSIIKSQTGIHYYQYFLAISLFFFLLILYINPKKDFNI